MSFGSLSFHMRTVFLLIHRLSIFWSIVIPGVACGFLRLGLLIKILLTNLTAFWMYFHISVVWICSNRILSLIGDTMIMNGEILACWTFLQNLNYKVRWTSKLDSQNPESSWILCPDVISLENVCCKVFAY